MKAINRSYIKYENKKEILKKESIYKDILSVCQESCIIIN